MRRYFEEEISEDIRQNLKEFYEDSDLEMHSKNQERKTEVKLERIFKMTNLLKIDDVLDIGCSSGFLASRIHSKVKSYIGCDISQSIIKNNQENNKFSNVSYYAFSGKELKSAKRFDKIFMLDILEHAFNPDDLLCSAASALKNDGLIIFEVPFTGFLSSLLTKKYHQGHLRYYDPDYLRKYLEKFNLNIEKIAVYNSVPFSGFLLKNKKIWRLFDFLCNLIPSKYYPYFGEIDVIARK